MDDILEKTIYELALSAPSFIALRQAGCQKIGDILNLSADDIRNAHPTSLIPSDKEIQNIKKGLSEFGLSLKDDKEVVLCAKCREAI